MMEQRKQPSFEEYPAAIQTACRHFAELLTEQLARVEGLQAEAPPVDFSRLRPLRIGICGGDGIGPVITAAAARVLRLLLRSELADASIELCEIPGLTLENRIQAGAALPPAVLAAIKACPVLLKGPTTTPQKGDGRPNLASANVALRQELDLFANIRPVKVAEQGIDWVIFRENTEGAYALGNRGVEITPELAVDFTITSRPGSERIARLAYAYARQNGYTRVSLVSKANVIKTTDGNFLADCRRVAAEYPEINTDEWYADILSAKLIDEKRRRDFQILLLPNLYGDIISDEAAEFQGGVGTAGAANLGRHYAMFEAIHGSAPRMVAEGRAAYADPSSMLRATALLLAHIGKQHEAARLHQALDACQSGGLRITGRPDGPSCRAFTDAVCTRLEAVQ